MRDGVEGVSSHGRGMGPSGERLGRGGRARRWPGLTTGGNSRVERAMFTTVEPTHERQPRRELRRRARPWAVRAEGRRPVRRGGASSASPPTERAPAQQQPASPAPQPVRAPGPVPSCLPPTQPCPSRHAPVTTRLDNSSSARHSAHTSHRTRSRSSEEHVVWPECAAPTRRGSERRSPTTR